MELLSNILISITTSAVVSGILIFSLKHYLSKWIDFEFEKRKLTYSEELKRREQLSQNITEKELSTYPEISEIVYRIRNIVREGAEKPNIAEWDHSLTPLAAYLTEILYKKRFLFDAETYNALHSFKRVAQDVALFLDSQTRPESVFSEHAYETGKEFVLSRLPELLEQHDVIQQIIQAKLETRG